MANFNYSLAIVGGRLTEDPELKATSAGKMYINFTIAVNRPASKSGERIADFIRCVAWDRKAEFISEHFRKGSSICVTGPIRTRSWEDQSGNKREGTDILVNEVTFVDSKAEAAPFKEEGREAPAFTSETAPHFEDIDPGNEDLPF